MTRFERDPKDSESCGMKHLSEQPSLESAPPRLMYRVLHSGWEPR